MDIDKTIDFATKHLSEYFETFSTTLFKPSKSFISLKELNNADLNESTKKITKVEPKLYNYVVISLTFGLLINSLIPSQTQMTNNLLADLIFLLILLFVFSTFIHGCCKALGGRGKFNETFSILLQLFSTLYVIESAVALIVLSISKMGMFKFIELNNLFQENTFLPDEAKGYKLLKISKLGAIHIILGALLLPMYMPFGLRKIHRFGWFRTILLTTLATLVCIAGAYSLFLSYLPA